ncbi:phage tail protein [Shewanella sp.]|uniref:phage tail-collar fiber domain-containing protein n=1 Tax=Shewanella sp. TaxID=50422 RepID=UPI003567D643
MASVITIAGEKLFAAKAQANEQLDIDTFIFANVPAQDPTAPINREEGVPTEHKVHQQIVQQVGRINENVVVYSTVLDSITGPFEFNWVGLYSSVNQTLVAINHIPSTIKTITEQGAAGNTLNRNFGIEYSGIADLTGITVSPETWQLDFTARLSGMDKLTQQLATDMNGKDWFIEDGFKIVPRATVNTFSVTPGVGYVSGLRIELEQEHILTLSSYPQFIYVDAWFTGTSNSEWKPQVAFTVTGAEMDDYIDPTGVQHYVYKLAAVNAADNVEDLRNKDSLLYRVNSTTINATVPEIESGKFSNYKVGTQLKALDRDGALFYLDFSTNNEINNGINIIYAGENKVAVLKDENLNIKKLGFLESERFDSTNIINYALANFVGELDLFGMNVVCEGNLLVPSTSKLRKIKVNGGKLKVKSGVFYIQIPQTFLIDLGGGEIDLGLKKAKLASDANNGKVFNVIDASEFSVGDVITCSFDLYGLPNDTARSTLPNNVLNTIESIDNNEITMKYEFTANRGNGAPGYTSIPAGSWLVNSVFTKAGIYYTGSETFAIINGDIGKTSSGTAVAVNNTEATFWSQNVDYDEAGLDMFNLRCKNIIFDGFFIGTSYDIAKQGVVPEWTGLLSMSKGKFKRNNFDGDFYFPYNSYLGDLYLSEVTGDGKYDGDIATGQFSENTLFIGKMPAQNLKLRSLKLDRCHFTNYQRNGFGSGDDVVTSATINSIEINNSECNVPWLRTTFYDTNTVVSSDLVKIYGGSMGCSTMYRQNAGFYNVVYDNVDLRATGNVRYLNCQIDNSRFNGGSHIIDSQTVLIGENTLANGGKVLMQTGQIPASAKLKAPNFKAADATGTFFPITNYVDSSLGQHYPNIELVVPDFVPKIKYGNLNPSIKYTIELTRVSETTAPFDCKSRHAVYIVQGSLVHGITDNTLYKSTATSTSVMSANYVAGVDSLAQNNSGVMPSVGDIFAVLYANHIVGYHRIVAASGNTFSIFPGLRENITTESLCALNKLNKIY